MNKALLFPLIISIFFTFHIKAQNSEYQKTGKIYFLRSTGINGALSALRVFIDSEFTCKMNYHEAGYNYLNKNIPRELTNFIYYEISKVVSILLMPIKSNVREKNPLEHSGQLYFVFK